MRVVSGLVLALLAGAVYAEGGHDMHAMPAAEASPTVRAVVAPSELVAGHPVSITLTLKDQYGRPLRDLDLEKVSTEYVHLFAVDGNFEDYQHLHPLPGQRDGEWVAAFTPQKSAYKVWVELQPKGSNLQFVPLQWGGVIPNPMALGKADMLTATAGGLRFTLTLAMTPQVGEGTLAIVNVYDDQGVPVTSLEPIMGAYAHLVGFDKALDSIMHIHPSGAAPESAEDKGGPVLNFQLTPKMAGMHKLYLQVINQGKVVTVPFVIGVDSK